MTNQPDDKKIIHLSNKIDSYNKNHNPVRKKKDETENPSYGWKIASELVGGPIVGLLVGAGFDKLFETSPLFLLIFFILGFAGSILHVIRIGLKSAESTAEDSDAPDEVKE